MRLWSADEADAKAVEISFDAVWLEDEDDGKDRLLLLACCLATSASWSVYRP